MPLAQTQNDFAAALFDPATMPAGLTTARGEADPLRFAIYRNNVTVALIKPLEARFPVLRQLVGDEFFRAMARDFIAVSKPASPLIMHFGDGLPDFVRTYTPAASVPYLPDMASLEAAWTRAYHARDAAPLKLGDIAALPVEDLLTCSLTSHPSTSLVTSDYPVGSIWAAHQHDPVQAIDRWASETVLILRPQLDVSVHILPSHDTAFAAALMQGSSIGDAAEAAIPASSEFDFGAALTGLVSLGAFESLKEAATP